MKYETLFGYNFTLNESLWHWVNGIKYLLSSVRDEVFSGFILYPSALNLIIGYIPAVCIGISLGLIGGGGSILAIPVLVYVMEVPAKSAIAMSLVIVGIVSLIGVIPHWQQGNVNFKTAALFAPAAMLGAYIGARIASLPFITPTVQLVSFAVMMLVAAFLIIRKGTSESDEKLELKSDSDPHDKYQLVAIPAEGLGVGLLTGFVGIGGGFMIIPTLVLLGKTPMKEAIGTSLIIIALKSVTGFLGYLGHVSINWNLMISFTVVASLGTIAGAYLTKFIDGKQLQKVFGGFVAAVAIFILSDVLL